MQHVQSPHIQNINNSSANLPHQQQLQQQFNWYCNYAGGPLLRHMPPGVPMLGPGGFIMGQAPDVPYYATAAGVHHQPVYSFQDKQFSLLPAAGCYGMSYQSPNSFSTVGNGNVSLAYATGTGAMFSHNENNYPVPSVPSLNAAQIYGGTFVTPTISTVIPLPPANAYYNNSDQFGAPAALHPETGHAANNAAQCYKGDQSGSGCAQSEGQMNERKRWSFFKKKNRASTVATPQINNALEANSLQSYGQYDVNSQPVPHSSNGNVLSDGDDSNGENPNRKMKSDPEDESYIESNDSWPPLGPFTSSIKEMSEQSVQDNSTMRPLEQTCNVPVSFFETNNSTLKIPYHTSQEKQHYRPGPASSKKKVPTTGFLACEIVPPSDISVKEPTQKTLNEAVATFDTSEFSSMIVENPSLVIPPGPHKKKKLIKVNDFVKAPRSRQHSHMVDTSDNRTGVLSTSKSKMLHEVVLFEKALEFEEGIFPDSQLTNHYSVLPFSRRISPSAAHVSYHQSEHTSKSHFVLNPLISTEPVEETILEERNKLTSQTTSLPNSNHVLGENLKEEFHIELRTNVPISSIEANDSTLTNPNQLDSTQKKQHYRPEPVSSKKKVPTTDSSSVKVTQETSNEAATARHETPLRIIRLISRPFTPAFKMLSSSLNGDKRSTTPPVKSGTGDKDENQACVRNLRSASVSYRKTYPFESKYVRYKRRRIGSIGRPKEINAGTFDQSISSRNQHVPKSSNARRYTATKEHQPLKELTRQMDTESHQLAIDNLKKENSDARRKSVQIAMDPRMTENPIKERDQMEVNIPNDALDYSPDFTNDKVVPTEDVLQSTIEIVKEDIDILGLENNNDWITLYLSQEKGLVTTTAESITPTLPMKYETMIENDFNPAPEQMEDDYSADLIPTPSPFGKMRARSTARNAKKLSSKEATSYISQDREISATPTTSQLLVAKTPRNQPTTKRSSV